MLVPHSEPCSTTLAVLSADYESCVSKGFLRGGFAVVQKPNTNPGGSTGWLIAPVEATKIAVLGGMEAGNA